MKVSLVDVDGHNFPNLALMKLSAWHKAQGDEVDWYMPLFSHPDRIYASKVFTFTQDFTDYNPSDPKPMKGGTGYDASITLPDEVESMSPDYSIYPQYDYAIGFLTRGCIRQCKWCVVPRKEGTLHIVGDIGKIGVRKHVVLMDNNFLAADEDFVHEQLEKSKRLKLQIDFNQALDARLVTTKNAAWLAKCSWNPYIRFSCDTPPMTEVVVNAIHTLRSAGYRKDIFVYVLAYEVDTALKRIEALVKADERCVPFVMPFRSLDGNEADAGEEVKKLAHWCNRVQLLKTCTFAEYNRQAIERRKRLHV